jgi:hypothetical protein
MFWESYAPTRDQIQTRTGECSYYCYGSAAFSGVAHGRIARAADDARLPAGMARGIHLGR